MAILCAVLVVAVVTATNDYSKDKQFRALNAVKDDVKVQARRRRERLLFLVSLFEESSPIAICVSWLRKAVLVSVPPWALRLSACLRSVA